MPDLRKCNCVVSTYKYSDMKIQAFTVVLLLLLFANAFSQTDSTFYQKGVARAKEGQFEEAVILFGKAIEASPQDPYAWFNRGLSKSMLERNEEAILDYNQAIEIEVGYKRAYLNRGISKRKLLDFGGAQSDFKQAIILAPNYAEAFYHRGYVFEMLEIKDSACYFYQRAVDFGLKQAQQKIDICKAAGKSFDKHIVRLTKLATDQSYGFSEKNPVKVGGGPTNQHEYLGLLRDPQGKPVQYARRGSCCAYKLDSAPMGMALLDRYQIYYFDEAGKQQTTTIYISFYEYEEPKVVMGFKTIGL